MATATANISRTTSRTPRHAFVLLGAIALVAVHSAFFVTPNPSPPTTYGASSPALALLGFVAGYGLLAAAVTTALVRPRGSIAAVTAALGTVWLAHDWVGWATGPALVRSVAMVLVPFTVPLLVHLALAAPSGQVRGRRARIGLGATYLVTAVVTGGRAMFRDPFFDLGCWNNCRDNIFLVRSDRELVATLDDQWRAAVIVIALATAVVVVARLARASPATRPSTAFVLIPSGIALLGDAWYLRLLADRSEDPTDPLFRAVFVLRAVGLVAVAVGVAWVARRTAWTRAAIARLVDEHEAAPAPGTLGPALARSFGDESLDVAYWLPVSQRWVDASGTAVDPHADRGRAATTIVRNGAPVALVLHDPDLSPPREVGAAARLAIDNERLRAEVLAQLDDLRASRARVVAAADEIRRRLERDLHDGAQQRLLAASFELRQAHATASRDGDAELAAELEAVVDEVQHALTELRDLAHGIFPAILVEAGLDPAVRQLADRSPIPVEVGDITLARRASLAESTAYRVVATCLEDAAARSAAVARVGIADHGDRLLVEIAVEGGTGAAWPSPDVLIEVGDRVGALGGNINVSGHTIRAEVPCAS